MRTTESVKRYRAVMGARARLSQILTPQPMADAVVRLLGARGGDWLELGSGSGRLAQAVHSAVKPASYVGVELEQAMIDSSPQLSGVRYLKHDVLSVSALGKALGDSEFDHVIGNPPYGVQDLPARARKRLLNFCPDLDIQQAWAPIDLYFVMESLSRLKSAGSAAFIVGADIPCGIQSLPFRKMLVETACEIECYELPRFAFGWQVEVQAYVLVIRFGSKRVRRVSLGLLDDSFELISQRKISPEQAIESMDSGHHEFGEMDSALRRARGCVTMKDLNVSIVRGSRTRNQFTQLGVQHFHTSDFPKSGMEISFENFSLQGYQQAVAGDILLPRVGTRCIERKAVVISGESPYSDSVFRVRAPVEHQERVVRWITSPECSSWRRAAARGACAKHLTVTTLLDMPVPV
ncbi:hypothetical protein [Pseudomonas sp. MWU13-2105]|uniref:hypothetical protein n=1 Tax=Pseudomonas sp. MWU13-2105 TaxID=2935074 RepID=UPI00200E6556|nr:hypothetical protein [Pseudomonas sp. MWU13-2105]